MSLKNKAMALGLSAAMLLSPAASLAESNYAAGELTTTAISDWATRSRIWATRSCKKR